MKRVLAWIAIVVMCAVVVITCITGVTGSKYFFGMLFMCMIVPVLLWAMMCSLSRPCPVCGLGLSR